MSTMFDVPMQDFSGEGSMDTDMLPLPVSDTDWLQVESMIEDDVSKQLVAEEVEMIQEDVQELEMTDSGDADILEYIDRAPAEQIQAHSVLDVFDQEIPDASRAASPTPIIPSIEPDTHTLHVSSILETHGETQNIDPNVYSADQYEETANIHDTATTTTISYDEHAELGTHDEHVPSAQTETAAEYVSTDTVESTREYDSQHLEREGTQDQEVSTYTEIIPPAVLEVSATSSLPEESHTHHEEYYTTLDGHEVQEGDASAQHESVTSGQAEPNDAHSLHDTRSSSQAEKQTDNTALSSHNVGQNEKDEKEEEDEESLVEPPPCVLLTYLFDGSQYALFLTPEENHVQINELTSKTAEPLEPQATPNKQESSTIQKSRPTLLFAEQSDLFYAPISQVFRAIRNDPVVNVGGRFDENVELVITEVGLDLRLSEDNIHAREVSLNDLSVLHTGCELTGTLSLQLDTIAPRFGTRYKAIRDALVSIVSNTDDHEHDQTVHVEGHEDTDAHQSTTGEEPAVSLSLSQTVHNGNHEEKAIDIKHADTTEEVNKIIDSVDPKTHEERQDEEAESDHENENENENEGIGHIRHAVIADEHVDVHTEPEGVQDEYYDEDAEGEYEEEEEEEQSYEGTHDPVDVSSYSENQEENPLAFSEENPQEDEDDGDDQNNEPTAVEDIPFFPEGPIENGLTPEQNSSASAEGSSYEASVHEEETNTLASNDDYLPSVQNIASLRVPSSKRSFDEHEIDQYDEDGGSPSSTGEATQKRLRLD
ncbi:hypothetical protein Clacol_006227 [Clathrus columnatus]|uniref:Uncharacterized protein n=1 Tax=Clathrus columnatus TaxID=1419009 RepID=A0AAV5AFM4_9AGAM|nr:hypothetical protein Clacol_006227 [Clathrus columnatus]